jgi:hypothetical protein
MTDGPLAGGTRRIDQVLGEGFADGAADLDTDEVRRRRELAREELEYLSLLRRLLQGRRDILLAEAERRRSGEGPQPVVERLGTILAEGPRGPSRGGAPVRTVSADEISLARRRVERLVSDTKLSNLEALGDDDLEEALEGLDREERGVSDTRADVIAVHDALQDEMKRRLRAELGELAP